MSKIPPIIRKHVEKALDEIDRDGVPARREATGYVLLANRRTYPPKYVLALAVKHATGREMPSEEFSGGEQTNKILRDLGFEIEALDGRVLEPSRPPKRSPARGDADGEPSDHWVGKSLSTKRAGSEPTIVRLVWEGRPLLDPKVHRDVLLGCLSTDWPTGARATFLMTAGGYFRLPFPRRWSGRTGWGSTASDLSPLIEHASAELDKLIAPKVITAAKGKIKAITIGVDLKHYDEDDPNSLPHAELVAVLDVGSGKVVAWTGKSYPVGFQARKLVHVADLKTHLVDVAGERVLVLGCHDLNMFNSRGKERCGPDAPRLVRSEEMARLVRRFKPTVVLHHPHQTDSPRIWSNGWSGLLGSAPTSPLKGLNSIKVWASGLAYYNMDGPCRADLSKVREGTRSEGGFDLVVPEP